MKFLILENSEYQIEVGLELRTEFNDNKIDFISSASIPVFLTDEVNQIPKA